MQSRHLDVHGLRVHVREAGPAAAPPVLLVHGIGVSSAYFVPLGNELARRFRVLAPDLPGFGLSEGPEGVPGIGGLADWLARIVDADGGGRTHAVANSMGCQILLELAAREPERFDRLVLVGPTVDAPARSFARMAARLALDATREPPRLLAVIARDYVRFGPRRLVRTGRSALDDRPEETARRVPAPTLVLRGEHDALISQRWADLLAGRLPHGRSNVLRGHAHAVHYSAAAEVAALTSAFLLGASRR